ncbi:hypothetical protein Desde_0819 [Desulfitobacterium dehalogenans ATCC 51507]|uniref:Uncharacterized protein n=1 Tax=Desulfitobacterium dehalogenans (strain ATCC 51507 / DSM 9161 / JW/IU-DC1) TaxID=756499 RepID=I4A5N0_DESDJ|nr:hypothetical protein [Desulfitobacterium dehalogenans]AFL99264.1 hypothetical protein Desde_0819 [Desulfitobacterium dehalogenans ATCC 51507]
MDNKDRDRIEKQHTEEEYGMPSTAKKKPQENNSALSKITSKAQILTGPQGMIKLNPKDQAHQDWYKDGK